MQTINRVLSQKVFKTLNSGGKNISVGWATQTDAWNRTQLSDDIMKEFEEAVQAAIQNGELPASAAKIIMTWVTYCELRASKC